MNRGISGIFRQKTNVIEEYQKKLEDIEESVRFKQSEASLAGEVCGNLSIFFQKKQFKRNLDSLLVFGIVIKPLKYTC